MWSLRIWAALAVAAAVVVVMEGDLDAPAQASYAGEPGLVAYAEGHEIYTMNADGSDQRRLTFDSGTFIKQEWGCDEPRSVFTESSSPTWTPDGLEVAFLYHAADDRREVRAIDPVVGSMRVLFPDWEGTMPSWSPGGERIAYGDASGLWVANNDGSSPRRVTEPVFGGPPPLAEWPASLVKVEWSPDGKRLAFVLWTGGGCVSGTQDVTVIDADGSNRHPFVCQPRPDSFRVTVDWAPDGQRLVCDDGHGVIMTVRPDGSDLTPLQAEGGEGVWSPDGSQILYVSDDGQHDLRSYNTALNSTHLLLAGFRGADMDWQPVQQVPYPIGLVDPDTGVWRLAGDDGYLMSFYYGNPGDVPFVGDWNCDSIDTPGLYRQSDGYVYLRNHNSQGVANIRFYFGNPGDVPVAGDFNSDGCDTVSLYRPSEQRFYIINKLGSEDTGLGTAEFSFVFGNPGDKPVVGDWDADGFDEIGLHRESSGYFYFRNTLDTGIADGQFYFGNPADRFIAGDWGVVDGADTPAVYRPDTVTFFFRHTLTQGNADSSVTWGGSTWLPVAGASFGTS